MRTKVVRYLGIQIAIQKHGKHTVMDAVRLKNNAAKRKVTVIPTATVLVA